jgi:hypothetical protein
MKIAYVRYKINEIYIKGVENDEDSELLSFLEQKGLLIKSVTWSDNKINWKDFQIIILKSPWDYHENISSFYKWLDKIKSLGIKLINPIDIIKWNSNKRYLNDISKSGLSTVKTIYLERKSKLKTDYSLFKQLNSNKIVIKPCISASAKNTFVVEINNFTKLSKTINLLLLKEEYLAQPFIEEIINEGEWSFIFFNSKFSHSALKIPKKGDFRVQHSHGGTIKYPKPKLEIIEQVKKFVERFAQNTLYVRVDGIIKEELFYLMEIEMIEPYLFLNNKEERMEMYYNALRELMLK